MPSEGDHFYEAVLEAHEVPTLVFEGVRDPASGELVDLRVIYRNEAARKISQDYQSKIEVGECVRVTLPNYVGEQIFNFNARIIESGETDELTVSFAHLGLDAYFVVRGKKYGDRVISTYWDVTEKTRADIRLQEFARRLDIATDAAGIGVWEHNLDTEVQYWDARTCAIHGLPPKDAVLFSSSVAQIVHLDDRAMISAAMSKAPSQPVSSSRHRIVRPDNGAVRWVQLYSRMVVDKQGRRAVGVCWDVTDEVEAAETLARKTAEAEAANLAKSRFLASMSHEIRTPMNGVLGMAQALAMTPVTDKQSEMVDVIVRSGEALMALLNDILDLSRIEAGGLKIEAEEFHLGELARDVGVLFSAKAEAAGLGFSVTVAPEADAVVKGDELRVRQILNNLVSNAIKFTETGEVAISIVRDPGDGDIVLEVRDTGVGIGADKLETVFDTFVQVDDSNTRRFGGSGLGLSIVRRLAEAMGGTASAVSTLGEGSTFTVRLPLSAEQRPAAKTAVEASTPGRADAQPGASRRVLLAEDNAVNRLVIDSILSNTNIDCVMTENGADALAAWEDGAFDVILLDISMPVMDGLEAAQAIRARERATGRPRTPIVAVTANVMPDQVAAYREAGMDGTIAKPIDGAKLVAAIDAATAERSAPVSAPARRRA
jgi:PAS domain S-box-containing protein